MTGFERLQRLIVVLEAVRDDPAKAREFDMARWGQEIPGCGTHYCACGWGAVDPVLSAQGLSLEPEPGVLGPLPSLKLSYKEWGYFDAAARFFEIAETDAIYLFDPEEYEADTPGIDVVIARIRKFIAKD